ncbi:MAG: hypothetical protein JXB03_10085 [Spirochaetales bacterium]|nr:hypothetical protein [Spirochaetales bacterium]
MKSTAGVSITLLTITLAVFFLSAGIAGIIAYQSTGSELSRALNKLLGSQPAPGSPGELIIAIGQLVAGLALALSPFIQFRGASSAVIHGVICAAWGLWIITRYFTADFLVPDFFRWLHALAPHLVVLVSLWVITAGQRKE